MHHEGQIPQSNEATNDEEEIPLINSRRVTRSATRLARMDPSICTSSELSNVPQPAPLPDTLATVVAPSPPTSNESINSRESATVGAGTTSSRRKRSSRSGPGAPKKKRSNKLKSRLRHSVDLEEKTADTFRIPAHTLILGFHPSQTSLNAHKYYATNTKYVFVSLDMCAHTICVSMFNVISQHLYFPRSLFWWIAGDCLGFRRAEGVGTGGKPYWFANELRYDTSHILPYEMQLQTLCCKG